MIYLIAKPSVLKCVRPIVLWNPQIWRIMLTCKWCNVSCLKYKGQSTRTTALAFHHQRQADDGLLLRFILSLSWATLTGCGCECSMSSGACLTATTLRCVTDIILVQSCDVQHCQSHLHCTRTKKKKNHKMLTTVLLKRVTERFYLPYMKRSGREITQCDLPPGSRIQQCKCTIGDIWEQNGEGLREGGQRTTRQNQTVAAWLSA